ncbi:MAG TPA: hypothetical protein ENH12_05705 [Proteobacteria bacterium]|nr:hypothetical protein [Pseudomonadota bacterium]
MKPTAVIPLMWETWEYREEDLDLKECSTNGIMVLGTNESAKGVNGPEYMGLLCAKFLLTNGIEILNNKIILVSKGDIALGIIEALAGLGAQVLVVTKEPTITIKNHGGIKIGNSLRESRARELISGADALIVHSFPDPRVIIGSDGDISADQLQLIAPGISVFQLEGNIDRTDLKKSGISVFPRNDPSSMHMGWDLTELGPRPLIALNAAGLKVGEIMARSRRINDNLMAARKMSLENPLCQDFSIDQKEMYGLNRRSND